uniref:Nitronate monooxygenase domain-containing protein n=1 Tax=Rhodosorus marinus TaxID=101924 RepID=A0A7S0FZG4_9RHOD|mmetsp:Transcript_10807/g.15593  ORF Transcript_10807/g.15593 Transcript_10807/m.15593 type:complete len:330 (+) Transcript_10807:123-1112(+)
MLGLRVPIVLAPMVRVSGWELASQVALAGGLGLIGVGHEGGTGPDELKAEYERALRSGAKASSLGFGFSVDLMAKADRSFKQALELNPKPAVVWLSFGRGEKMRDRIEQVRDYGVKVMTMAHSVGEAVSQHRMGSNAVVLQSGDAGGHGTQIHSDSYASTIPEFRTHVGKNFPVLAAGGIVAGDGLAAALTVGADGVVVGTRFSVCKESTVPPEYKRELIGCDTHSASLRSGSWDLFAEKKYPPHLHARAVRNAVSKRFHSPVGGENKEVTQQDKNWFNNSGMETRPVWAGAGVARITKEDSAKEVIDSMLEEARSAVNHADGALRRIV